MSKAIGIVGFSLGALSLISIVIIGDTWLAKTGFYVGFTLVVVWSLWGVFLSIKETIEARKHIQLTSLDNKNMRFCKLFAAAGFSMTVISYFLTKANGPSSVSDVLFYVGWVVGAIGVIMCARKIMKELRP